MILEVAGKERKRFKWSTALEATAEKINFEWKLLGDVISSIFHLEEQKYNQHGKEKAACCPNWVFFYDKPLGTWIERSTTNTLMEMTRL